VRLVGVDWSMETPTEVLSLMDKLDTFRGLDEAGNNLDKAVVSGTIHVPSLTGEQLAEMNRRYPNITIDYDALTVRVAFYNGEELVSEAYLASGSTITKPANPTKESTAQYDYTFKGWSLDGVNVVDVTVVGDEDTTYYAVYTEALRYYTIRFINGSTVLQTSTVAYGEMPVYSGSTPVDPNGDDFGGWIPEISVATGNVDYVAKFKPASVTRALIKGTLKEIENEDITTVIEQKFKGCSGLVSVNLPNVKKISAYAFDGLKNLKTVVIPGITKFDDRGAFRNCSALEKVVLPADPPSISYGDVWLSINSACVFYVPTGSLSTYQSAGIVWSSVTRNYSFVEEDRV
jgi:hypothetical protein